MGTKLRVEMLSQDLKQLPRLWRSSSGPWGYVTWFAKTSIQSYNYYDSLCVQSLGEHGSYVMPVSMTSFALWNVWQFFSLFRMLAKSLMESDTIAAAVEDASENKKKNK